MGFKIIGNRSEEGEFIASADAWPPEKWRLYLISLIPIVN